MPPGMTKAGPIGSTVARASGPTARPGRIGRQHPRSSSPRRGIARASSPHVPPTGGATERRKWTQVAQLVLERRQTQHRAASGCGVRQCGQRQFGMTGS